MARGAKYRRRSVERHRGILEMDGSIRSNRRVYGR
jgi:hypothetical protein